MNLTLEQRLAVHEGGNVCLVACPGSGKTRTVVAKILRELDGVRESMRRVGAITYTNAAVDEIVERLHAYGSSDDHTYYEVSTIHSFCLSHILGPFHYLLPPFRSGCELVTGDDDEWRELVQELLAEYGLKDSAADKFDQIHRRANGNIVPPREIPGDVAERFVATFEERAWVSFSDVVYHSACLVAKAPFIASAIASRFQWLIVDEFQDTSDTQVAILEAIAQFRRTRFMFVGDPNQSIMSFAGASPALMPAFAAAVAARLDLRLTGNHRSSSLIIAHAERLCPTFPPMAAVGKWETYGVEPEYHACETALEGVAGVFLPRLHSLEIPVGRAAVFAPWWLPLYHLAQHLRKAGVPVIGPGARPYRRHHEMAFLSEHLCAYLASPVGDRCQKLQRALFITLLQLNDAPEWRVYTYEGRVLLFHLIGIAKAAAARYANVLAWLPAVASELAATLVAEELISEEAAALLGASAEAMLADMRTHKINPADAGLDQLGMYATPEDSLQLMTMHAAKGKEFDAVALVDLHEGHIPHWTAKTAEEVAEARRLFYVGVTRARKVLMYFTDRSDDRNQPTRFLGVHGLGLG